MTMDTMQHQFIPHIRNTVLIEIGQVEARRAGGIATHSIGPGGKQTRLGHASGWVDTGDVGFINASGLTISSPINARLVVPQGSSELPDIESKLRQVEGLRPELLAVVLLRQQLPNLMDIAVRFSAIDDNEAEVKHIAAKLFADISSMTGLRPTVYHCRPGHMPMTASLNT